MQRSFNTTDTPVVAHSCDLPTPEELPLKCPPPPPSPQKDSHDQSMIIVVDEANDFEEEQQPTADYHHHHDQQQQQHFTTNLGNPMFLAAYPCPPVLPYYRRSGRVKFFSSQKGYGFIIPNDPNEVNINGKNEIFVHHTAIHNDGGFKSLGNNESVEYDLSYGPKGLQASFVTGPGGQPVIGDGYSAAESTTLSSDSETGSHNRTESNHSTPTNANTEQHFTNQPQRRHYKPHFSSRYNNNNNNNNSNNKNINNYNNTNNYNKNLTKVRNQHPFGFGGPPRIPIPILTAPSVPIKSINNQHHMPPPMPIPMIFAAHPMQLPGNSVIYGSALPPTPYPTPIPYVSTATEADYFSIISATQVEDTTTESNNTIESADKIAT